MLIALSATVAAERVAAEQAAASDAERGYGKLGTAPLAIAASMEADKGYGKLGAAHLPGGTSAEESLDRRLADRGMKIGSPIMIRIFKAEAALEVWMKTGERFELLSVYSICNWAGTLGPKLREGDMQSPEGLYSIGRRQLHSSKRWRRSLDIGYPNAFDRVHARTGSSILVHGGCTSTGCFAMTDQVMDEIFRLSLAALSGGQKRIAVHIFPFRMTSDNVVAHADSHWQDFWANLKEAYDLFERTRLPPTVKVCGRRYVVSETDGNDGCPVGVAEAVERPLAAPNGPVADAKAVEHPLVVPKGRMTDAKIVGYYRPGPSARQAYADARTARLAARARLAKHLQPAKSAQQRKNAQRPKHAQRVKQQAKRRHVQTAGYRKLPR